jgi:hypothetical protein
MIASLEIENSSEQRPKSNRQAQPAEELKREQSAEVVEVEEEDIRDEFEYQRKLFFGK